MARDSKFRAFIKNEGCEVGWFVYVEQPTFAQTFACRFGSERQADIVARAMNKAWEREGRLWEGVKV